MLTARIMTLRALSFALAPVLLGVACGGAEATSTSAASATSSSSQGAVGSTSEAASSSGSTSSSGAGGAMSFPAFHPSVPQVESKGGPVLKAPKLVGVVFDVDPLANELQSFVQEMGDGKAYWAATTSEYGVGALMSATTVLVHQAPPTSATSAEVAAWLEQQTTGASPPLGAFDEQTMYLVFYPTDTNVILEGLGPQCQAFGGYHLDAKRADGKTAFYAVIPRCPGVSSLSSLDVTTTAASHELVEGAADPHPSFEPAFTAVDDDHLAWGVAFSNYPVAEIGDLCALTPDDTLKPKGFTHAVQRIWSNAEAKADRDPCVPVPDGAIYFNAVPVAEEKVTVRPPSLPSVVSKGVHIAVGAQKTIDVELSSNAPRDDWSVAALDVRNALGEPKRLDFAWDRTSGHNGDVLHLTITALAKGPVGGEPFAIYSSDATGAMHVSFAFVEN